MILKPRVQFAVFEKEPAHGSEINGVILGPFNTIEEAEEKQKKYGYTSDNYYVGEDNTEMLQKIRKERPNQVIHQVISFKENEYGFYDVKVDMESMFFESKIKHTKCTLPYPFSEYEKLSEKDQFEWRFNNL
jgi:hypothetical protein